MSNIQAYQSIFYHIPTIDFLRKVLAFGVSKSNLYQVKFDFVNRGENNRVFTILKRLGFNSDELYSAKSKVELLCSSASIPGATVRESTINSVYPGYELKYPTGGANHEFVLTFYMDKEMLPYKFFHGWLRAINPRFYDRSGRPIITKSRFYDEIVQDFYIYKFPDIHSNENKITQSGNSITMKPRSSITRSGENQQSSSGNTELFLRAIDCYPINVGSITQSYESSSILSFSVSISARDIEFTSPKTFEVSDDFKVNLNRGINSKSRAAVNNNQQKVAVFSNSPFANGLSSNSSYFNTESIIERTWLNAVNLNLSTEILPQTPTI